MFVWIHPSRHLLRFGGCLAFMQSRTLQAESSTSAHLRISVCDGLLTDITCEKTSIAAPTFSAHGTSSGQRLLPFLCLKFFLTLRQFWCVNSTGLTRSSRFTTPVKLRVQRLDIFVRRKRERKCPKTVKFGAVPMSSVRKYPKHLRLVGKNPDTGKRPPKEPLNTGPTLKIEQKG